MKKNFTTDYLSYIALRLLGPLLRLLPLYLSLFLGRRIGDLLYYFDPKHKCLAYANIRRACGTVLSPRQLSRITRKFYHSFGQSLIEVFLIPRIDKEYMKKYIKIEGEEHIFEALKKGKGVILLGVHAGSWELSNVICANLGFPFRLLVRDQGLPLLNKLLNSYRRNKGCRLIQRQSQTRELIEALKSNEAVGMTADQGGKNGELVEFFGRNASMSSGAFRIAVRYQAVILPAYYARVRGPYHKVIIEPPFEIKESQNREQDIHNNLQRLTSVFEKLILKYPQEYLWTYKIWKYAQEKNILILSDAKTGHLRQSQAAARIIKDYLEEKKINTHIESVEVKFKNNLSSLALKLGSCLSGKYCCQGCSWCLKRFLSADTYQSLIKKSPDVIISCGSSLAPVNFILSRENTAKSILIMRPSILGTRKFDLVILSRHDRPPKRRNIVATEGALNLIDAAYLKEQSSRLLSLLPAGCRLKEPCLSFLIGGDTKKFSLSAANISEAAVQIKGACERLGADILVTTSRRTSREVEDIVKKEFRNYPPCKLLVVANEKNIPEAIGGMLGLSRLTIISPESISMISEAVNSGNYTLVFESPDLGRKHRRFLHNFAENKYIYLVRASELGREIERLWLKKPPIVSTRDNFLLREAIGEIL